MDSSSGSTIESTRRKFSYALRTYLDGAFHLPLAAALTARVSDSSFPVPLQCRYTCQYRYTTQRGARRAPSSSVSALGARSVALCRAVSRCPRLDLAWQPPSVLPLLACRFSPPLRGNPSFLLERLVSWRASFPGGYRRLPVAASAIFPALFRTRAARTVPALRSPLDPPKTQSFAPSPVPRSRAGEVRRC
jgi:hypothetical protein